MFSVFYIWLFVLSCTCVIDPLGTDVHDHVHVIINKLKIKKK